MLLPSYNKTKQQQQNKTNTHTRPKTKTNVARSESTQNKGQLFQLIRTFATKVGVWKESESEVISLMQLISNSKLL